MKKTVVFLAAAGLLVIVGEVMVRSRHDLGFALLLAGLVCAFLGTRTDGGRPADALAGRAKAILLAGGLVLFVFALWLRIFDLDQSPPGFYYDEAQNGLEALKILRGENAPVFVGERSHVPALFFWSTAASFGFFGIGPVSVRLVSALCGAAAVPALVAALSRGMGVPAVLLAGLAFAGLRWSLNFSRIGFLGMQLVLLELLVLAFLILGFKKNRLGLYVLSGLCLGLSLYSYLASPVVVAVAAVLWIQALATAGSVKIRRGLLRGLAAFVVAAGLVFAPLAYFYYQNPGHFGSRTSQVSLVRQVMETGEWGRAWASVSKHLRMFHQHGDNNPRHNLPGEPVVPAAASGLAILGAGVALRRWRDPESLAPLALGLGMIQGGIWTNEWEAPQAYRTLGMMVAFPWLGALYLDQAFRQIKLWDRRWLAPAFLAAFALVVSGVAYDVDLYFRKQVTDPRAAFEFEVRQAEVGKALRLSDATAQVFVDSRFYNHPTVVFLSGRTADQVQRFDILNYSHVPPAPNAEGPGLYLLEPFGGMLEPLFRYWYGKQYETVEHLDSRGGLTFVEIRVSEQSRMKISKVKAVLDRGRYKLQGLLPISKGKLLRWKMAEDLRQGVILKVDRKQVLPGQGEARISGGLHPVSLTWPADQGSLAPVLWTGGERPWDQFGSRNLIVGKQAHGLLGHYRSGGSFDGEATIIQLDPMLLFRWHIEPISPAYTTIWQGWLKISQKGRYDFRLNADDEAFLYLNKTEVVRAEGRVGPNSGEGSMILKAGWQEVEVRYRELGGLNSLTWLWKIPGNENYKIVPPEALLPPWERPSIPQ